MKNQLLAFLFVSLSVSVLKLLSPKSFARHIRFLATLFLIAVLTAPLPKVLESLHLTVEKLPETESPAPDSQDFQDAMNGASKAYIVRHLTDLLEQKFALQKGDIRCAVRWKDGDTAVPEQVTLILSNAAIWKNPKEMEACVTGLLGCPCDSVID